MRIASILCFPFALAAALYAQSPGLTLPPSGNNQKAITTQFIGPVRVSIEYSSPAVHGPDGKDRRGQIWGKLVPYGMTNLGFGTATASPWRGGANENTVFSVSSDVSIEGQPLPAGRYGFHLIPGEKEWTLIFSKDAAAWGSFYYDENNDALRVKVQAKPHEYREWLTYEFPVRKPSEATAELQWEDLSIPFTITVPDINQVYISHLKQELNNLPGFTYQGFVAAAQFCISSNSNLEQGLKWADASISMTGVGQTNFTTLSTKAQVLSKMGREAEAKPLMMGALKSTDATSLQIHMYGRQLITDKKYDEALAIFKLNQERNGDAWPVHVGLARGYSATGDNQKALEHAKKALEQAPDPQNKQNLEAMVKALSEGRSIN